ncbi:MAG: hypothetical protein HFJ17_01605 [Clostridia bacterium]|jgi:hypothetical protein|nr:hypothetical protein [Clostridia bacterium]
MEEVIIKDREFKEKLAQLINESGLPAFILKPSVKEVYEQLNILEQQQYQQVYNDLNKDKEKEGEVQNDTMER